MHCITWETRANIYWNASEHIYFVIRVREMDTDQVKEWMSDNGYAVYADAFAGNSLCIYISIIIVLRMYVLKKSAARMDGIALLELIDGPYGYDGLVELLPLASAGDREKLLRYLRENSEVRCENFMLQNHYILFSQQFRAVASKEVNCHLPYNSVLVIACIRASSC